MKSLRLLCTVASLGFTSALAFAADAEPAYLDFSNVAAAKNGQLVDIDLDTGLLSLAARFAEGQEKEAAEVLRGLKHVRIHVIGLDDTNRASVTTRIQEVRTGLTRDGWKRLATVRDQGGQDVAIYARTRGDEAVEGLAITVVDGGKEAVVVNIVGDIRPEQIAALGQRFDIEPLKKISVAAK